MALFTPRMRGPRCDSARATVKYCADATPLTPHHDRIMIGGSARAAGAIHWTVSLVGLRQCAHHPCSCSAPSRSRLLRSERNPRHRERGPLMHVSFPHWFGATSVHSAGDGSPPCRGSLDSRECSTPARRPAASGKRRAREKRGFPSSTLF